MKEIEGLSLLFEGGGTCHSRGGSIQIQGLDFLNCFMSRN